MRKEPERRYAVGRGALRGHRPLSRRAAGRGAAGPRLPTGPGKFVAAPPHRRGRDASWSWRALAGGVWATLREARRARAAEARAERRFNDVRKLANSFLFEFHDAIRDLPGSTAARALVVKRALEYLDGLAKESAGDRALRRELAEAYQQVGDVQGNPFMPNLGDLRARSPATGRRSRFSSRRWPGPTPSDAERATLATAYLVRGALRSERGQRRGSARDGEEGSRAAAGPGGARLPAMPSARWISRQAWQYVAFDAAPAGKHAEAAARAGRPGRHPRGAAARPARGSRRAAQSRAEPLPRRRGVQQRGDLAGALGEVPGRPEQIQEELVAEDPSSVQFRRDLAYSQTEVGNTGARSRRMRPGRSRSTAGPSRSSRRWRRRTRRAPIRGLGVAMAHHNAGEALGGSGRRSRRSPIPPARASYETVVAASPSGAWASGMLGMLYVQTADLESGADRARRLPALTPGPCPSSRSSRPAGSPRRPIARRCSSGRKARAAGCSGAAGP